MAYPVRTRFAPSPTGYLHIGGVRTALFNWLFARHHGGQFILRIDDTDQQRNVAEALQPILDGFRWLGIDWDEGPEKGGPYGPYYQSEKPERYKAAVRTLLDKGLAYYDYSTAEERQTEEATFRAEEDRQAKATGTRAERRPYVYSRKWMAQTPTERALFEAECRQGVVRLKMPRTGHCRFHDHIRGDMEIEWVREQDHVIQRADGSCLYNLASVVDDHDMRITHVIRAEEHLSNTPRQIFIAQGLGYELPEYAHVPFVAEPGSKSKLSKRKIAQYLKNPDFKKVFEQGESIIERIATRQALDAASFLKQILVDAKRRNIDISKADLEVNEEILLHLPKWLREKELSDQADLYKVFSIIFAEKFSEVLKNPKYLETYEYGNRILKTIGTGFSPESFNPVIIDFYRQVGYLPDAIHNYLVLLGWSLDDKTEFFMRQQMIDLFSLERVNKAPASFDPKKLFAFQERYMQLVSVEEKTDKAFPYLQKAELVPTPVPSEVRGKVKKIVTAAGDRIKVFGDILDYADFFLPDEQLPYDESAFEKRLSKPSEAAGLLEKFRDRLAAEKAIDPKSLEGLLNAFVQQEGIQVGQIIHALRVAVTGKAVGFGLYETMAILGMEHCLARIDRALARLNNGSEL